MTAQPTTPPTPTRSPIQFTLITAQSALTATLSALLQARVSENDRLPTAAFEDMTVFHALEPPAISVADYVARVSKYVFCSEACLVAAYHYVNLAVERQPKLALTSLSIHRMFIAAVVLACKYFDDVSYNLVYYSRVGGLPHKELANLEISLLRILDFRLDISAKTFVQIEAQMVSELSTLELSPINSVTADLVAKAKLELSEANIVPIEFELLSDEEDVDFSTPSRQASFIETSPAASTVTEHGSKMSRNSSMSSMQEHVAYAYDRLEKPLAHSPTTPTSHVTRC